MTGSVAKVKICLYAAYVLNKFLGKV